jgi:hypothetical protein
MDCYFAVCDAGDETALRDALHSTLPPSRYTPRFAVVSMFFALHYFFESPRTLHGLLHNVQRRLTRGGLFVGTAPIGRFSEWPGLGVAECIGASTSASGGQSGVPGTWANSAASLTLQGPAHWQEFGTGVAYTMRMENTRYFDSAAGPPAHVGADGCRSEAGASAGRVTASSLEYLVDVDGFMAAAAEHGLRAVSLQPFSQLNREYQPTGAAHDPPLKGDELEVSNLSFAFILERVE